MDRVTAACDYLFDLRRTRRPVAALPADVVPRSLAEGYEVQDRLVRKLLDHSGGHPIGYKIACTSELAQKALGVDGPFFGVLLSHSTHPSPATLRGVGLHRPLRRGRVRVRDGRGRARRAGLHRRDDPGVHRRGAPLDRDRGPPLPRLAGGRCPVAAGRQRHPRGVGRGRAVPRLAGPRLRPHPVALVVNGEQTFPGSGAAVLGNPLTVVAWLANELPRFGRRLRRGDRVTTGVTTGIYLAQPGDRLAADFGPLGRVGLDFARA